MKTEKPDTRRECRSLEVCELRTETRDDEPKKLVGYAAMFNNRTWIGDYFQEEIAPGAFTRAIDEKQDVRGLINHDPNLVIGRTTAGTLTLSEDDTGLRTEFIPPDTQAARDLMVSVERGDINQMSFGFLAQTETWSTDEEKNDIRTIVDADLFDVSVVTYPAYPTTSVSARSAEEVYRDHKETSLEHEPEDGDKAEPVHEPVNLLRRIEIESQE